MAQGGCLLPFLILFNLIFGLIFFKPLTWVIIEASLLLLFIINSYLLAKKINTGFSESSKNKRGKVIDVQGYVVKEDSKRLE